MVLSEVVQGGDAYGRVRKLIDDSAQTDEEKRALVVRADEIFDTLTSADVIEQVEGEGGVVEYACTVDLPEDFALDQPLSPFLLAALELLDPESDSFALDVISMAEATLENPRQVLRAQERAARDKAMQDMKADGVEYEERLERLAEITYPRPLEELLDAAFERYCREVPWARDFRLEPKSVLRDMLEGASDFKGYVQRYGIARSEGTLLRYLSDAYRVLDRTVPADKRDERLVDVIAWLGFVVRSVDSSLVDEWESAGSAADAAPPSAGDVVVADRRGLTVLVRNALFQRVRLASQGRAAELGKLDQEWGCGEPRWQRALDAYFEVHEAVQIDADARSTAYLAIDEADVILFLVEVSTGITDLDTLMADILRRTTKKVILVCNKVDNYDQIYSSHEFYKLGLGDPYCISSMSGSGTGDLMDAILEALPAETSAQYEDDLPRITIVGRPNVGKSSLTNALLGVERNIVTPVAGTTRDSIHTRYNKFGMDFYLVDTAGMRKKGKVTEDLEFYSVMRSIRAIENSDVCVLMLDAEQGLESQDLNIHNLIVRCRFCKWHEPHPA